MDLATAIATARETLRERLRAEQDRHAREMFVVRSHLKAIHPPRSERDLMRVVEALLEMGLLPDVHVWQPSARTLAKLGRIHAVERKEA
jgi:hypothetical protein